jgi:hypothetical protein
MRPLRRSAAHRRWQFCDLFLVNGGVDDARDGDSFSTIFAIVMILFHLFVDARIRRPSRTANPHAAWPEIYKQNPLRTGACSTATSITS